MSSNLLDDLEARLINARDDMQTIRACQANRPAMEVEDVRARRARADRDACELICIIRELAKQHRRWLVGRVLRTPRRQTICELHYAVNGDGHVDRGVRFHLDHEADTLEVWWLPAIVPTTTSPDTQIVVVGGIRPDVVFTARASQIEFAATVAAVIRAMISVSPNWHVGERPTVSPVVHGQGSETTTNQTVSSMCHCDGRFTKFRRRLVWSVGPGISAGSGHTC